MNRLWLLTVVVAAVFLVIGLGHRLLGDDGPSLYGELVDLTSFQACLEAADPAVEGWRIVAGDIKPLGNDPDIGTFRVEWDPRQSLELTVLPDRADAAEIDSALNDGESPTESWANVVMRPGEGGPPAAVSDAVYKCSDTAASAGGSEFSSFEDCGDAATQRGIGALDIRVRGVSCEAGEELAQRFSFVSPVCTSPSRDYLCASFNICCGTFVSYLGRGEEAVVFKSGI